MTYQSNHKTGLFILIAAAVLVTFLLFFHFPTSTGSAVTSTPGQTSVEHIQLIADIDTHLVRVIETFSHYRIDKVYSPWAQLMRESLFDTDLPPAEQKFYGLEYHHEGDPLKGVQKLRRITDDHSGVQEYTYADPAYPDFPSLVHTHVPLFGPVSTGGTALDIYTKYIYQYAPHLKSTVIWGWRGSSIQEVEQAIANNKKEDIAMLHKEHHTFIPAGTQRTIDYTYTTFEDENRYLTLYRSLITHGSFILLEMTRYNYVFYPEGKRYRLDSIEYFTDKGNDGTFEDDTIRRYTYQGDLLVSYTDTFKDGTSERYDFHYDRSDQYAALLDITNQHNERLVAGYTYGGISWSIPVDQEPIFYGL